MADPSSDDPVRILDRLVKALDALEDAGMDVFEVAPAFEQLEAALSAARRVVAAEVGS